MYQPIGSTEYSVMSEHRLDEIVIERPRGGMNISLKKLKGYKKRLHHITEEASDDGLLSPYLIKTRNKSKYLSDHLGPIRRFLRSKVGQPWNQIHQELCQRLDTSTVTGQHVLDHIWDYVERHVEVVDGVLYRKASVGKARPLEEAYRVQFYVHPETGLLCAIAPRSRKKKPAPPPMDVVEIDAYHHYRQWREIWYFVTFEEIPNIGSGFVYDIFKGMIPCQARLYNNRRIYAVRKRQCNKKEIRYIMQQILQRQQRPIPG